MSKIRMRVKFQEEKDVLDLIKFFQNVNLENSIDIQGKEVEMEIVFRQQSPMEIINEIKTFIDIQLKISEECGENDAEQKIAGNESIRQNIPELEKVAKRATSFDHFAKLIVEWLEIDERKEAFRNLLIASTVVNKIRWRELEDTLLEKNLVYTQYNIQCFSYKLRKKLKGVTPMNFLKAVREYKEYPFKGKEKEILDPRPTRVKMNCMPEIKDFEETLASVDKTWSVDERVRYVLETMGMEKISVEEQKFMIEIVSKLMKKKRMDSDIFFVKHTILRMKLSELVNEFVQRYDEKHEKIKLLTFLSDLQKCIISESEIENF